MKRFYIFLSTLFAVTSLWAEEGEKATAKPLNAPIPELFADSKAMATLPLEQLLKLHEAKKQDNKEQSQPMAFYTLEQVHNSARLLEDALDIQAEFKVAVLKARWVAIELLQLDGQTQLAELPDMGDNAFFRVEKQKLYLITKQVGRFNFFLRFFKFAKTDKQIRKVAVNKQSALAMLQLHMDPGLFELAGTKHMAQGNKLFVFPKQDKFVVSWRNKKPTKKSIAQPSHRPLEPVVLSAHSSTVATLSGKGIIRILYKLRFTGQQNFEISIPKEQELAHVFLNGSPQVYEVKKNGLLSLLVKPARAGDQTAQLELLLRQDQQSYVLSGDLEFQFPKVSWRINDLYAKLHLPKVFNYQWKGGSLVPSDITYDVQYSHAMPTPGKVVTLHQQLIRGFPLLRLDYTVDLTGNYYTGHGEEFLNMGYRLPQERGKTW